MVSESFAAVYYDGRTSGRWPVEVQVEPRDNDCLLHIHGNGIARRESLNDVHIEPPVGTLRGQIRLADGAMCEVDDGQALLTAIPAHYQRRTLHLIHRIENKLHYIAITLVLAIAIIWSLIEFGVPVMARSIAAAIPVSMEKSMGEQVLSGMDRVVFAPTTLEPARR
ncbi:MAG: hypothetical protein R6X06_01250, partial [Gammaproteobacteria bacterium]